MAAGLSTKTVIVAGTLTLAAYFGAVFGPFPARIRYALFFFFGPLLIVTVVSCLVG